VAEQKKITKGTAALLLTLSAMGAIASAKLLDGWHVYLGFFAVGIGLFIAFLFWNRKQ